MFFNQSKLLLFSTLLLFSASLLSIHHPLPSSAAASTNSDPPPHTLTLSFLCVRMYRSGGCMFRSSLISVEIIQQLRMLFLVWWFFSGSLFPFQVISSALKFLQKVVHFAGNLGSLAALVLLLDRTLVVLVSKGAPSGGKSYILDA